MIFTCYLCCHSVFFCRSLTHYSTLPFPSFIRFIIFLLAPEAVLEVLYEVHLFTSGGWVGRLCCFSFLLFSLTAAFRKLDRWWLPGLESLFLVSSSFYIDLSMLHFELLFALPYHGISFYFLMFSLLVHPTNPFPPSLPPSLPPFLPGAPRRRYSLRRARLAHRGRERGRARLPPLLERQEQPNHEMDRLCSACSSSSSNSRSSRRHHSIEPDRVRFPSRVLPPFLPLFLLLLPYSWY